MRCHFFQVNHNVLALLVKHIKAPAEGSFGLVSGVKETKAFYEMATIQAVLKPREIFFV